MALKLETLTNIGTKADYWTVGHLFLTGKKEIKVTCSMYLYTSIEAYESGADRIPDISKTFEFSANKEDLLKWGDLYVAAKEKFAEFSESGEV